MVCTRHPMAAIHRHYCPACLLEVALTPAEAVGSVSMESLRVQVPLGRSASASVFLVRTEGRDPRLLRLKVWHTPAPAGFLERFQNLQARLAAWPQDAILSPLAASVDAAGCPLVVTEFRQGIPILDRVRSGRLDTDAALASLRILVALTMAAHVRGLAHGSVVAGNVLVQPASGAPYLLDFGFAPLFGGSDSVGRSDSDIPFAAADVAGFASLARTLRELPASPGATPGL
jgi:serine/threonine protein kinase